MATCAVCGGASERVAAELGVCGPCIRKEPRKALPLAAAAHDRVRRALGLPKTPPADPDGVPCGQCVQGCRMAPGALGYCGLRRTRGGAGDPVSAERGKLSWYRDPLPTNCVASWVCAGGTGDGRGSRPGAFNLAAFFHACSFDCLYCQNESFRHHTLSPEIRTAEELAAAVDDRTACICFFGGDPTPQVPFSIAAARRAMAAAEGRPLRVCWETNGSMDPGLLDGIMDIAVASGGCVKFDLKAWNDDLHRALTGATNRRTLSNFRRASRSIGRRPEPPPLVASTLLVPGYVDPTEIEGLSRFIASIDPEIPYSLLAFYPRFRMDDLPMPTRAHAEECLQAAKAAGLRRVRIGNRHLLVS